MNPGKFLQSIFSTDTLGWIHIKSGITRNIFFFKL